MNSIDVYSNEKDFLIDFVRRNKFNSRFRAFDGDEDSCWIAYSDSNHCGAPFSIYNSEDIKELRIMIDKCLGEDMKLANVILSAIKKTMNNTQNAVPKMDLHNYMM